MATNNSVYEMIVNIAPPGNDNLMSFELKLSPDDAILADGRAKRVRDCTLSELSEFANLLEADVAALLDRTVGDLVDDPEITVKRSDDDDLAWLDHIVILEPVKAVSPPSPDINTENAAVDPIIAEEITFDEQPTAQDGIMNQPEPDVEAEIALVAPEKPETAVMEEIAVIKEPEKPEPDKDDLDNKPDELDDSDSKNKAKSETKIDEDSDKTIVGLPIPKAIDAVHEDVTVPIEEIDPAKAVSVSESEPIHEEREATEPFDQEAFKANVPARTAGIVSERWLDNTVDVLLDEEPLRRMQAHASSSLRREVAGVMLGPLPEKQPNTNRYVVHVRDMIIAKHTKMRGASVTYTPESWRYLNDVIMERYPNEEMVMLGWYHTHPGFGIFLSGMDLFIHKNFFVQKWHVAYVLDPIARKSGFFSWDLDLQQVKPYPFIWPEWAAGTW